LRYGDEQNNDLRALYVLRHGERAGLRRLMPNLDRWDLSFVDELTLTFQERYNTTLIGLLPDALRPRVLRAFHACGILPYAERDWHELGVVRERVPSLQAARGAGHAAGATVSTVTAQNT
jgi:hypothetical protein